MPFHAGAHRLAGLGLLLGIVLAPLAGWTLGDTAGAEGPEGRRSARKLALIVSISEYGPATGWGSIHADNDVFLIRAALAAQGFEPAAVQVLRDRDATHDGILRAFREGLIKPAGRGDLVAIFYSGHGQRITDDNGDELDGYDEALVPYDAPTSLEGGYRGERHLRDDTLHRLIRKLRNKVGSEGHVVVFLDSCFSGTPRGVHTIRRGPSTAEVVVRGGPPLGKPRSGASRAEAGSGFFEALDPVGTRSRGAETVPEAVDLARYVVFSAARHDQLAHETVGDQGLPVGSLTYAWTRELADLDSQATYHGLYDRVRWLMARRVSNEPQVEGDIEALLFQGDLIPRKPFVAVASVAEAGARVTLAAGSLAGLAPGARVELHREGTRRNTSETRIASGVVVESTPVSAVVELEDRPGSVDAISLSRGRAFVLRPAFGNLKIPLELAVDPPGLERRLRTLMEAQAPAFLVVEDGGDLILFSTPAAQGGREIHIETYRDRRVLLDPPLTTRSAHFDERIARRLAEIALHRYLRKLDLIDEELTVSLELVPVQVGDCPNPGGDPSGCDLSRLDPESKHSSGNAETWRIGDLFKIRVENSGRRPAFLNLLDLAPDATVRLLWPDPRTGDKTPLPAGRSRELNDVYRISQPEGNDVLLLLATDEWLDLRAVLRDPLSNTPFSSRGDPCAPSDLFSPGQEAQEDWKIQPVRVSTSAVTITVLSAPGSEQR